MLHGATDPLDRFRAAQSHPSRFDFDTAGFTVVDYRDIPGRNIVALIDEDQPCLAEREIRHVAEPILLLAHADRDRLAAVDVAHRVRDRRRRLFDPEQSHALFKNDRDRQGRRSSGGSQQADVIVEGEYRTGHQEQLYIETNGVIAVPDGRAA